MIIVINSKGYMLQFSTLKFLNDSIKRRRECLMEILTKAFKAIMVQPGIKSVMNLEERTMNTNR